MALKERKNKKDKYSPEYLDEIKCKDFSGRLTPDEVEIARVSGLLVWDLHIKAKRKLILTGEQHRQGIRLAPVFDGRGVPDSTRYTKDQKFLIKDYEALDNAS